MPEFHCFGHKEEEGLFNVCNRLNMLIIDFSAADISQYSGFMTRPNSDWPVKS